MKFAVLFSAAVFFVVLGDSAVVKKPTKSTKDYYAELTKLKQTDFEFPSRAYPSETDLPTPEMIAELGYDVEVHHVTTQDGYILQMHRIPRGKGQSDEGVVRTPIYLQHGLLCSSSDWVITGDEKGLAFILADQGFDVWMGNVRGNTYSRGHLNPDISDEDYWNFSFDEHGHYDGPAMVKYIQQVTGQEKMFYIAHSMGTMMFWIASDYYGTEWTDNFIGMFGLGPVAQLKDMVSPLKYIAPLADDIAWILQMLGLNEFLPSNDFFDFLASFACEPGDILSGLCSNIIFLICGYNKEQLDPALIPYIVGHTPAGTSTKNILHFAQGINRSGFNKFDYGKEENLIIYGTETPPAYDLSKVDVPVFLFYGENDWLTVPRDVEWLKARLPRLIGSFKADDPSFNHLDFLWAIDAITLTYNDVLKYINLLNPNPPSSS